MLLAGGGSSSRAKAASATPAAAATVTSAEATVAAGAAAAASDDRLYSLSIHDLNFSTSELVINPDAFPTLAVGDLLEIYTVGCPKENRLVLAVDSVAPIKGGRLQVSLLKSIADGFGLGLWSEVVVRPIDAAAAAADFVEFTIKDQFIPRADILRFKRTVFGSPAHRSKAFNSLGVRASVRELTRHGQPAASAVLTERTNFIFRSRSSRIFWLVQISIEMYEYAPTGQLYLEIFMSEFVAKLVAKWKAIQATHSLTIVFFTRTFFLNTIDTADIGRGIYDRAIDITPDGRAYEVCGGSAEHFLHACAATAEATRHQLHHMCLAPLHAWQRMFCNWTQLTRCSHLAVFQCHCGSPACLRTRTRLFWRMSA